MRNIMNYHLSFFISLLFVFHSAVSAEFPQVDAAYKQFERHYLSGNHLEVSKLYSADSISMFEYKPAIFGKKNIRNFYRDLFRFTKITSMAKKRENTIKLGDYWFDYGVLKLNYHTINDKKGKVYLSKYLHIWQQKGKSKLSLYAELYGSTQYYDPNDLPHSSVEVVESLANQYYPNDLSAEFKQEVEYANTITLRSINIGDYNKRLAGFTDDVIAGRIFKPWMLGKEQLKPEIFETYRPERKVFAWHRYYKLIDLSDYILLFGHFKGGIGEWKDGARFEGNFITLRRRNNTGEHPVYFIIANNDRGFKGFTKE